MKRQVEDDESSDDEFGPKPVSEERVSKKSNRRPTLAQASVYLRQLPTGKRYEKSLMHRDVVTHVCVSKSTEFVVTGSLDGHVKFWKKLATSVEFVKHYQAHLAPLRALELSSDGLRIVSTAADKMIKFFDVRSFDLSHMISVDYKPSVAVWLSANSQFSRIAVGDCEGGLIRIHSSQGEKTVLAEVNIHSAPVRCMCVNLAFSISVSCDALGQIEYWHCESLEAPDKDSHPFAVNFKYKMDTDLFVLRKSRVSPCNIVINSIGDKFALTSTDKQIRIFDFKSGKMKQQYDESLKSYESGGGNEIYLKTSEANSSEVESNTTTNNDTTTNNSNNSQNANIAAAVRYSMSEQERKKRVLVERELEAPAMAEVLALCKPAFDESGNFLIYSSMIGIKVLCLTSRSVLRIYGQSESSERFLSCALYQGIPLVDTQYLLSKAGADAGTRNASEMIKNNPEIDPTLFCTRDVMNEIPDEEDKLKISSIPAKVLPSKVVLHTSFGDIFLKLFPKECPKTVENFTSHCRSGYYSNCLFHRVIHGFMLQTGDPCNNGTGGESIFGGEFEDEFDKSLKHDRAFTLSMANCGPNTNGSQFFITTAPTPWLDNKHTVFGRVTQGFEVVSKIESVKVNKNSRPLDEIKILSCTVTNA